MVTLANNQKMNRTLTGEWACPDDLFNRLNNEFHFTLDACAHPANARCQKFYTSVDDGLKQDWKGQTVWCFPPSGRKALRDWVYKAANEARKKDTTVVMLLPVSTDSHWFQTYICQRAGVIVRFLPERVKYTNFALPSWASSIETGKKRSATRPSMVVIFTGKKNKFRVESA